MMNDDDKPVFLPSYCSNLANSGISGNDKTNNTDVVISESLRDGKQKNHIEAYRYTGTI